MSTQRTLATFTVIIAVSTPHGALLVDWPSKPADLVEPWLYGPYAADNGFEDVPTQLGIWRCTCQEAWGGDDEPTYTITASEKLLDLGTCTATYEEFKEERVPA